MNPPKAKKQFGQNFLTNPAIPQRIAEESGITNEFGVIEVGPGRGILTEQLALKAKKVVAVEIDKELVPLLNEKFEAYENVEIVEGDILDTDIAALIEAHFKNMPVAVCANIPYYITSPIIMKFIEGGYDLESVTVMVQKEVAQRLCAQKNTENYSALTVVCDYYSTVKRLFAVSAGCFTPKPKVDSAVIRFDIKKQPPVNPKDLNLFFDIIKAAFAYRRKTLANCLNSIIGNRFSKDEITNVLLSSGFSPNVRGEELDIYEFERIANEISVRIDVTQ